VLVHGVRGEQRGVWRVLRELTAVFFSMSEAVSKMSVTAEDAAVPCKVDDERDGFMSLDSLTRALEGSKELSSDVSVGRARGTRGLGKSCLPKWRSVGVISSPFNRKVF
jgi:hypothetical protein